MLVRHFMTRDVLTLQEGDRCVEAYELFRSKRLRRAPVVNGGKVVGMISDRDLLRALPWSHVEAKEVDQEGDLTRTVGKYMCRNVVSVTPRTHLEDVARLMLDNKIGGLPVLEGEKLVGIITESDIFKVFVRMNVESKGTRITLQTPSAAGSAPDPVNACLERGQLLSGLARYTSPAGTTMVTLHVAGPGADALPDQLSKLGFVLMDVAKPGGSDTDE